MAYHRVWSSIWTEPWSEDARTLALYLLTCEHRVTEGLFRLPMPYAGADLQWDSSRLRAAWTELCDDGFLEHDERAQVVFLPGALERQQPQAVNNVKAAVKAVEGLPKTRLLQRLYAVAQHHCEQLAEHLAARFPELTNPPTNSVGNSVPNSVPNSVGGSVGNSPAPPPAPTPTPENPMSNASRSTATASTTIDRSVVAELFDHWRQVCRHPQAKPTAERLRAIKARLRDGYTPAQVRQAIDGAARDPFVNVQGKRFDDLTLICRNGSKLEDFIDRAGRPPGQQTGPAARPSRQAAALAGLLANEQTINERQAA